MKNECLGYYSAVPQGGVSMVHARGEAEIDSLKDEAERILRHPVKFEEADLGVQMTAVTGRIDLVSQSRARTPRCGEL